jgi:hypothetical protein
MRTRQTKYRTNTGSQDVTSRTPFSLSGLTGRRSEFVDFYY